MIKKNKLKAFLLFIGLVLVLGGSVAFYIFNMPHRDVQSSKTDYALTSSQIVNDYLENPKDANQKYLDSEGDSKIIEISGTISTIAEDFNGNKVVLLKSASDRAGVSCTFTPETNANVSAHKTGDKTTIKGVIRSGASFDTDLDMYEDVIMEKCDVILSR